MKKYTIIPCLFISLIFIACNRKKNNISTHINKDSIDIYITTADSSVYGHLGEETGMSSIELITFNGDTLSLNKTNESTGEPGIILGEISNYTDTFAVVPDARNEYMNIAVNINQLCKKWISANDKNRIISLNNDKSVVSSLNEGIFNKWKLQNNNLLLEGDNNETLIITFLSLDSLCVKWDNNKNETFYPQKK